MRFIIKLIIGMILFNGFIALTSMFFPSASVTLDSTDVLNSSSVVSGYQPGTVGSMFSSVLAGSVPIFGTLMLFGLAGGGFLGVLNQNSAPLYIAIALIISIFAGIYNSTIQVFSGLMDLGGSAGIVTYGIFTLSTIVIGLLIMFGVADMLSGRTDSSG